MMILAINIILGLLPAFVLGASISTNADEDEGRRRNLFFLVYGLWALTLAGWNWMRGNYIAWVIIWGTGGVIALASCVFTRRRA